MTTVYQIHPNNAVCPVHDCPNKRIFKTVSSLRGHMTRDHNGVRIVKHQNTVVIAQNAVVIAQNANPVSVTLDLLREKLKSVRNVQIGDALKYSVLDCIRVAIGCTKTKADNLWSDNFLKSSEFKATSILNETFKSFQKFQFVGQGQRLTPILNFEDCLKMLAKLPNKNGEPFRELKTEYEVQLRVNRYIEKKVKYNPVSMTLDILEEKLKSVRNVQIGDALKYSVIDCIEVAVGCTKTKAQKFWVNNFSQSSEFKATAILNENMSGKISPTAILNETFKSFEKFQFVGERQRPTPILNLMDCLKMLAKLPGKNGEPFRSIQAEFLARSHNGCQDLIDATIEQQKKIPASVRRANMDGIVMSNEAKEQLDEDVEMEEAVTDERLNQMVVTYLPGANIPIDIARSAYNNSNFNTIEFIRLCTDAINMINVSFRSIEETKRSKEQTIELKKQLKEQTIKI